MGCFAIQVQAAPFTIDCSLEFEDDLKDWAIAGSQLTRNTGDWFGQAAQTPDFVLGGSNATSADIIFTPVKNLEAGKPCTIEFYFNSPGGTPATLFNYGAKVLACSAQDLSSQIAEVGVIKNNATNGWVKYSFTFTPEADGDVCFAIQPTPYTDAMASRCGWVGFDSFVIEGSEKDGGSTPAPAGTPFTTTFDFENDADFPGIATLPKGWASTGVKPIRRYTAAQLGLPAAPSGQMVLGNYGLTCKEDNNLFTQFFALEGGTETEFSFSFSAKTESLSPEAEGYGFRVYASKTQSLDEAILIGTIEPDKFRSADWVKSEVFKFIPEESDKYCFIITAWNDYGYTPGGPVGFDDITVSGYEADLRTPDPETPKGEEKAFTIDCPLEFEDDLSGWAIEGSNFTRNTGDWFGYGAQTPDFVLGGNNTTSADIIFTPVKKLVAGKPCTIEFYFNSPGGTPATLFNYGAKVLACSAQDLSSQIAEVGVIKNNATNGWVKYSFTFTPEADGDVCFAIQPTPYTDAMASRCGWVGFDSFIIEGTELADGSGSGDTPVVTDPTEGLEPNEDHLSDCIDVPYLEDFNGGNYDGTSYLPKGWVSTGSVTWVTSSHKAIPAVEGSYYMVASHNVDNERDDRAYTPFMNLQAGTEYTISFHVYMQGNRWNDMDQLYLPKLDFTVGTEQEADFHNVIGTFSQECTGWVAQSFTFTPAVSGPYTFGFMLSGPQNSGYVFVDALKITAEGLVPRVEPSFVVKGLYSVMDDQLTIGFKDEPITLCNTTKYGESYKWTIDGAQYDAEAVNPGVIFPADGTYDITLEATNSRGSRRTKRSVNIHLLDKSDSQHLLTQFNGNQDQLVAAGETPVFDTDESGDFVTGYNHYYFDLAQRFDFGKETTVHLNQMTLYVTNRRFRSMTSYYDDQRIRPFSLVIYGADNEGNLDEGNVLGRLDGTIGDILGSTGLYNTEARDIIFPSPIAVSGTFYIAMHFDRGMEVIPQDATLGRSFFSTQVMRHGHGQTSIYAKPFDTPAASTAVPGQWTTIDQLDGRMSGLGAYWMLWANVNDTHNGLSAITPDGQVSFAATFVGDNLNVSGTSEGQMIRLYNHTGACLLSAPASEGVTVLSAASLPAGLYIVASGTEAAKVFKKN